MILPALRFKNKQMVLAYMLIFYFILLKSIIQNRNPNKQQAKAIMKNPKGDRTQLQI